MPYLNQFSWILSGVIKVTIATAAIAGIIKLQQPQLQQLSARDVASPEDQRQEELNLSLMNRSPSFGLDNILADWAFLNFVQYDGDTATRKAVGYPLAPNYFEMITRLDPRFVDSYVFLSGIMSYQMGMPKEAIALMDRGTSALTPKDHPRAFLVWRLKGLDQLLMANDLDASQFSYDQAGDWALASSDASVREAGPIFKQTAEFIRTDPNNKTMLLWSWSTIYDQAVVTRDQVTQARARERLLKIGAIERKDEKGSVYFLLPPQPKSEPNSGVKSKSDPTATPTASPTPAIEPPPAPKPSI
ncbi:MAG: hypothetical protein NT070_09955 [Cyanobacteria bacterium]|nr:hypothetical protein [Cyanobacteriota bacterium]